MSLLKLSNKLLAEVCRFVNSSADLSAFLVWLPTVLFSDPACPEIIIILPKEERL
jgi:hypothetical protein